MSRILKVSEDELESIVNRQVSDLLVKRRKFDPASLQWFSEEQSLSLAKAHSNTEIWNRGGRGLFITKMDGTPATTLIRFNDIAGSTYEVRPGHIKGAFQRIYLTNAAEAGKTLKFIVGYRNFAEFMLLDPATAEGITSVLGAIQELPSKVSAFDTYIGVIGTANNEYSQLLPDHTKFLDLCFREGADQTVRIAFETGKVATPVEPYRTLQHLIPFRLENLDLVDTTLYWAGSATGIDLEYIVGI